MTLRLTLFLLPRTVLRPPPALAILDRVVVKPGAFSLPLGSALGRVFGAPVAGPGMQAVGSARDIFGLIGQRLSVGATDLPVRHGLDARRISARGLVRRIRGDLALAFAVAGLLCGGISGFVSHAAMAPRAAPCLKPNPRYRKTRRAVKPRRTAMIRRKTFHARG
ncbi:hypothetical protein, partial [Pararhodobacter marinus]|uniref:hypothetical protein n=1 Tax=Pararhodobacter marinus TaxID=2184063 RepID=UPI0035174B43